MEIIHNLIETEERLAWHKPELHSLVVSLDTAFEIGSNIDGAEGELK